MKSAKNLNIILVTAPDIKCARALARAALDAKLIACANLIPRIESHYWWQGKIESGSEVLLILKTTHARIADLEQLILAKHPYETPEILCLPITSGTSRYLTWLTSEVADKS